jgi:cytoskeleton protein RodZ
MESAAALDLKSEREKKKISLAQIAADTHISLRYLQCIEEGRFSDLPGGVYNRAFLKAYCESINIDPGEVLEQYTEQTASVQPEKHPKTAAIPLPQQKRFQIHSSILIWSIMLLISVIGIYFSRGWISDLFSPYFSDKNSSDLHHKAADTNPAPSEPEAVSAEHPGPVAAEFNNLENAPDANHSPVKPDGTPESVLPTTPAGKSGEASEAVADAKLKLEISATDPCWISVESDDVPKISRIMETGETRVFRARKRLRVTIGNAGGIHMKINGEPSKPLGKPGEVIRMNIDSDNYQQFIDQSAG